jgi:hypothetical protein
MTRVPYSGDEHALDGGNVAGGVVRVGDTVRKPAGFWTPAVEALLSHLGRAGFTGAPRPLGRDGEGRQVLEYVPGPMAMDQPWLNEAGLRRVGRLIRELHDASAGFSPPPGARWNVVDRGSALGPAARRGPRRALGRRGGLHRAEPARLAPGPAVRGAPRSGGLDRAAG